MICIGNGTFDVAATDILFHVLRPHPVSYTLLGPIKICAFYNSANSRKVSPQTATA